LGKLKFDAFLEHYLGTRPGPLVDYDSGLLLGEHRGFWFYTLGQRKGIGLSGGPWYVVSKNPENNVVYVSTRYDSSDKPRDRFNVAELSWVATQFNSAALRDERLHVKVRHGPRRFACRLSTSTADESRVTVALTDGQAAHGLAPGQFAAFYRGDECLGAGVICSDSALDAAPREITGTTPKRLQAQPVS